MDNVTALVRLSRYCNPRERWEVGHDPPLAEQEINRRRDIVLERNLAFLLVHREHRMGEVGNAAVKDGGVESRGFRPGRCVLVTAEMLGGAIKIRIENLAERATGCCAQPMGGRVHDKRLVNEIWLELQRRQDEIRAKRAEALETAQR